MKNLSIGWLALGLGLALCWSGCGSSTGEGPPAANDAVHSEPGSEDASEPTAATPSGSDAAAPDVPADPDAAEPDVGSADAGEWAPSPAQAAAFEQLVEDSTKLLSDSGVPGAAIAVVLDGRLAFTRGLGVTNINGANPVSGQTPFQLMSVSKMFVAATAMSLVDEGLLDVHAPLEVTAPWLTFEAPFAAADFTMHQVLSHSSGLGTMMPADADPDALPAMNDPNNLAELFEEITVEVWTPPEVAWNYSNFGYVVAALVIEEAAGGNLFDLAAERILGPAGMTHSTFYAQQALDFGVTDKHSLAQSGELYAIQTTKWDDNIVYAPMAGMYASAEDLAVWAALLLGGGGEVLSEQAVAEMTGGQVDTHRPDGSTYGYGLMQGKTHGVDHVTHNGAGLGYASQLTLVPEHDFAVVALVNADLDYGLPADICDAALERMLLLAPAAGPVPVSPPSPLEAYAGTYLDTHRLGELVVELQQTELRVSFTGFEQQATLQHLSYDTFALTVPDEVVAGLGLATSSLYLTSFPGVSGQPYYLVSSWAAAVRVN